MKTIRAVRRWALPARSGRRRADAASERSPAADAAQTTIAAAHSTYKEKLLRRTMSRQAPRRLCISGVAEFTSCSWRSTPWTALGPRGPACAANSSCRGADRLPGLILPIGSGVSMGLAALPRQPRHGYRNACCSWRWSPDARTTTWAVILPGAEAAPGGAQRAGWVEPSETGH
jgi:hypothetical protein